MQITTKCNLYICFKLPPPPKNQKGLTMPTISACLIVKNEERFLTRCLSSFADIVDEIIIVDTGSTDRTKEIAACYTDKIYDFTWINDFAAARNFSFEQATKDYIYVADADEIIDEENRERFKVLKQTLLPEIEVVEMLYVNQLEFGTTYNFDRESRPKLYKRLRTFRWVEPIHETVEALPLVYNSDIEIIHKPDQSHAGRDFDTFQKIIKGGHRLSAKLVNMYARELFIAGEDKDFIDAHDYFLDLCEDDSRSLDEIMEAWCVLARSCRLKEDIYNLFKHTIKGVASENGASELCYELGEYFYSKEEYKEAMIWYYNAAYETTSFLNVHYSGDYPLLKLAECCQRLGNQEQADIYEEKVKEWIVGDCETQNI